jgi:hypothetical protein
MNDNLVTELVSVEVEGGFVRLHIVSGDTDAAFIFEAEAAQELRADLERVLSELGH